METYLCDKCNKLFYSAEPTSCPYCNSVYVIWVTYKERTKEELEDLFKKAMQ